MRGRIVPLGLLKEGDKARILNLHKNLKEDKSLKMLRECGCDEGCGFCRRRKKGGAVERLKHLGFEKGQVIEVIKNQPGQPLIVSVENTRIALSRGLAMKVWVELL